MRSQAPPMSVTYSYRQAIEDHAFVQFPLLAASHLGDECKNRGIELGLGSRLIESLEAFDRAGALWPVLFEMGPRRLIRSRGRARVPRPHPTGSCRQTTCASGGASPSRHRHQRFHSPSPVGVSPVALTAGVWLSPRCQGHVARSAAS